MCKHGVRLLFTCTCTHMDSTRQKKKVSELARRVDHYKYIAYAIEQFLCTQRTESSQSLVCGRYSNIRGMGLLKRCTAMIFNSSSCARAQCICVILAADLLSSTVLYSSERFFLARTVHVHIHTYIQNACSSLLTWIHRRSGFVCVETRA